MFVVISYGFLLDVPVDNDMLFDAIKHLLELHELISIEARIKCPNTSSDDVSRIV